jgi:hypothetical protein
MGATRGRGGSPVFDAVREAHEFERRVFAGRRRPVLREETGGS